MHHHDIVDNSERTGTIIGTTLGAAIGILKQTILSTLFNLDIDIHSILKELIESTIICIPTAAIGAIIGYYVTKLLKKIDKK